MLSQRLIGALFSTTSSMRAAQYALPGETGEAEATSGGELIFFYFGPNQGGSAEDNVARWVGQFSDLQSKNVEHTESGPLRLTLVRAAGTYALAPMGPRAPRQAPQADHALFGLIVEGGPQGSVFVRATGPESLIEAQTPTLNAFARSVRRR